MPTDAYDIPLTKVALVERIYRDKVNGFGSIADTTRQAKQVDPTITHDIVRQVLQRTKYRQIHYTPNKHNSFISMDPHYELELDIMDLTTAATEHRVARDGGLGAGPRYALAGLDNFTKKGAVIPIVSRSEKVIIDATRTIMEKLGVPQQIYTDQEAAFMGKAFQRLCDEKDIKHIPTTGKAQGAERFIRTIKENLFRRLEDSHVSNWTKHLKYIVDKYNNSVHTTIGLTPNQAEKPSNEMFVRYNLFDKAKTARKWPPIVVGDIVRIKLIKKNTAKGYDPKYSNGVFRVQQVEDGEYTLQLSKGDRNKIKRDVYRRWELLKVDA